MRQKHDIRALRIFDKMNQETEEIIEILKENGEWEENDDPEGEKMEEIIRTLKASGEWEKNE